mgnify:FL=1
MAVAPETAIMALYCDFENVALGVRDAKYDKFDIKPVLERLLLKGSIVVKKAYCDWERYKGFKSTMHEASFELIEIPHVRQTGKNSADIRLVVDALDLCYTKSHVDTFVIISGDSDFSPLVSKLRENAKYVIGVGVKQSTSDLLIGNCDEFIFYDDLVREMQRSARRDSKEPQPAVRRSPEEDAQRRQEIEERRSKAIELAVATFDALVDERGDSGKIWASMLKEAIKRRKPDFNESYYGFRAFGNLLEEARARGLLDMGRDEKSGTYVFRSNGDGDRAEVPAELLAEAVAVTGPAAGAMDDVAGEEANEQAGRARPKREGRRKAAEKGGKRTREVRPAEEQDAATAIEPVGETEAGPASVEETPPEAAAEVPQAVAAAAVAEQGLADVVDAAPVVSDSVAPGETPAADGAGDGEVARPVKKPATRSRRPRKPPPLPESA